jgi:glycosyltransferase involved in cell wall biosynthesis
MLIVALKRIGWSCSVVAPIDAPAALSGAGDDVWIDTLYLDDFATLAARAAAGVRVGLLAHYLPSLVRLGDGLRADELSSAETQALASAHMFLVPSAFMRATIARLTATSLPIVCVEPGHLAQKGDVIAGPPVRAALVANLLPGKGIEPFLTSLAARVDDSDTFHLSVVGSASFDPQYADRCTALGQDPGLRGRVRFLGALSPLETVRLMADCNVVLSASTMEAYGMALAEARTLGLPIVARAGGNVARLVEASSGGEVVESADALAESFLVVCRDA